ncbi:branched-chain amino acid ABC transporter permease [Treponema parvum]|uniref:Branched-chain amino acid ABC transporter permease n=1 Tax=Treponema parvum TaxID=138851 RepID=A0A975F1G5_9SPIR|nr:branched-chain amino acid ABC transporter permease [Treponema parvum]QTQ12622.1 branched-chain amino acid ABC transporter permease [Treponema parvum]
MRLFLYVLTQVCITLVSVCGINILTGLTGMFSLGSAAFMAIGAYVSGLLVLRLGISMYLAFIIAIAFSVCVGFIIGFPVVRLRRDYISLVTLGFGESIAQLILQLSQYTGGAFGLIGVPRKVNVWFTLVAAIAAISITAWFKNSKYGRQCIAIKSDELAAKAMGINAPKVKMIAFLLSCAMTAFAGCLYAFYVGYVGPTDFGWKKSADWVIMVFFGGVNSLTGSIFGGAFLTFLPQYMQSLNKYRYIVYAILVLLILNFKPNGIFGEWELSRNNLKRLFKKSTKNKERD